MFTRITLLLAIFTSMGLGGYLAGQHTAPDHRGADHSGLPHEHPLALALESKAELQLSAEQVARLENLRDAMAAELDPVHARLRDIHQRAARAHQAGDRQAMEEIEKEMKALESVARPTIERFGQEAAKILTPDQQQRLAQIVNARRADHGSRDFMLMYIMHAREQLGITPQQFTQLQFLQADFIRSFAPLREQMELLHMQMGSTGNEPPRQMVDMALSLEQQIKALRTSYSNRAIQEVLSPEQRQRLEQMLRGGEGHGPGHHGGGHHGGQHGSGGHGGQHGSGGHNGGQHGGEGHSGGQHGGGS